MKYINFNNDKCLIIDQFKDVIYRNIIHVLISYNNSPIWLRVLPSQIKSFKNPNN